MTVHQEKPDEKEVQLLWTAALSWGYLDGCIRMRTSPESAPVCLMENHTPDKVRATYPLKCKAGEKIKHFNPALLTFPFYGGR